MGSDLLWSKKHVERGSQLHRTAHSVSSILQHSNTGVILKVHRLAEEGLDMHTLWPTYTSLGVPLVDPGPSMIKKHKKGEIALISRRSTVLEAVNEKGRSTWS